MSMTGFEEFNMDHNGRTVFVQHVYDDNMGPPWKEHDGHGPVRSDAHIWNGSHLIKRAGERQFGGHLYDVKEAIKTAKKEGWYTGIDTFMHLTAKHRRVPTKGMIAAYAVEQDFNYLQGWVDNDWYWVGVVVTDLEVDVEDSLWGIESSDEDYLKQTAHELAEAIYVPTVKALLNGEAA